MKKLIFVTLLLMILMSVLGAVKTNEYYFRFFLQDKTRLNELNTYISIDNVRGNYVYAYANQSQWDAFSPMGFSPELLPHPSTLIEAVMSDNFIQAKSWDSYPTYDAYVAMMNDFALNHPTHCQIIDAGNTVNGRKILFARISNNLGTAAKPLVMYTATMHGDETVGYVLMLRLIDTLLGGYGSDPRITNLMDNLEIWINPNGNPDGTYNGGNSTVNGAIRNNAGGVDLNRNFPNQYGNQEDGNASQPETTIMKNIALANRFALSANFHGGAEVVNYPWDYTYTLHPDNDWYISLSQAYASSAQANSPAGYLDDYNNGITNGAAWYVTTGNRQDWMNFTGDGRETTIEISATKLPEASTLPNYWTYNYDALLTYLEYALRGIHGMVTDVYGNPLSATITVNGLDNNLSVVTTNPAKGDFYRFLSPGTYDLTISTSGYDDIVVSGVVVSASQKTPISVIFGELPYQQEIPLQSGWNWISINSLPVSANVEDIFAGVPSLVQVKSRTRSYNPAVASVYNTLQTLETGVGYWVNVSSNSTLVIPGTECSITPIPLTQGWNYVGFQPQDALNLSTALSSVQSYVEEVRYLDQTWSSATRNNTLNNLEPGKAYWIKVSQDCSLVYPE